MSRLRSYAQLVRLPNLPTAWADIGLAALALSVHPPEGLLKDGFPWLRFFLVLFASSCLYMAGMIWNDWFDLEQDKKERPFRPLPSGRISTGQAARAAAILMAAGVAAAFLASWPAFFVALGLVAAIFAYDGWLKNTVLGPATMGLCRFLNVLLGLSVAGTLAVPGGMHLAAVVGLYVAGVTWFAHTEARESKQTELQGAAGLMLMSLLLALPLPATRELGTSSPLFPYLLVALGFLIGFPVVRAVLAPSPNRVQAAVKRCLMGLVILDAVLATALAGTVGLVLLLLLVPVIALNSMPWLYAT